MAPGRFSVLLAAVGLLLLSSCGGFAGDSGGDLAGGDASAQADGGKADAGRTDAGRTDAGKADAGKAGGGGRADAGKADAADGAADAGRSAQEPTIISQPVSLTVLQGGSATFSVEAEGTAPLRYQWAFEGQNLSGAIGASYTVSSASAANTGSYTVTVANGFGSAVSDPATLTIASSPSAPKITQQPVSQTVSSGSSAKFSVAVAGTAPLAYEWAFEGKSLSGATSASYTIASAAAANAGTYTVTVSNSAGSVESAPATLTVTSSGGACDQGTTTTTWATNCPTSKPSCTAGTWVAGGPDPDHSGFRLISESEHFAVYSDESPSAAKSAVDYLETVWSTYFGSPIYMREPLCNSATKYKASIHVHGDWGLTGGDRKDGDVDRHRGPQRSLGPRP